MNDPIFDLEQQILDCWKITDDINLVYEEMEKMKIPAKEADQLMNLLLGLSSINDIKFNQLFETFEKVCKKYHSNSKQVKEMRDIIEKTDVNNLLGA